MKLNGGDTCMNSCWIEWHYINCWKWPLPSARYIWTQCCVLSTLHCRILFSVLALQWCEVCSFVYSPSCSPKERNLVMSNLVIEGATLFWDAAVLQFSSDWCGENECHSAPSTEDVVNYSCTVRAWTGSDSEASSICLQSFKKLHTKMT